MRELVIRITGNYRSDQTLIGFGLLASIIATIGLLVDMIWMGLLIPAALLLGFLTLYRLTWCLITLFFVIPLSAEMVLPGGLGVDIPGEPILWLLMVATILILVRYGVPDALRNVVTTLLLLHLFWK